MFEMAAHRPAFKAYVICLSFFASHTYLLSEFVDLMQQWVTIDFHVL